MGGTLGEQKVLGALPSVPLAVSIQLGKSLLQRSCKASMQPLFSTHGYLTPFHVWLVREHITEMLQAARMLGRDVPAGLTAVLVDPLSARPAPKVALG